MLTPTENIAEIKPMATGILSLGKVSLTMPKARVNMPMPTPCRARKNRRTNMLRSPRRASEISREKPLPSRATTYSDMTTMRTLFFPWMSPSLPTRGVATAPTSM